MYILRCPTVYLATGVVLFVIGVLFLIKGYGTWGFFLITLAFALFTLFQGVRSQRQIILNQNEIFERLIDRFGDIRINLYWDFLRRRNPRFTYTMWRCRTIVDRAWKLVKYSKICKKNQKRLFRELVLLMYHSGFSLRAFLEGKTKSIPSKEDLGNMLNMSKKFYDFKLEGEKDIKELDGLIKILQELMQKVYSKDKLVKS